MKIEFPSEKPSKEVNDRRKLAILSGYQNDEQSARHFCNDEDPTVRASAYSALDRMGKITKDDLTTALMDQQWQVRRKAAELAINFSDINLVSYLQDDNPLVAEQVAWALGEKHHINYFDNDPDDGFDNNDDFNSNDSDSNSNTSDDSNSTYDIEHIAQQLSITATQHEDPLCRESAVASLGMIGHPAGLNAILQATHDKPQIRRRAVIALSVFDGDGVKEAFERLANDRDWQVRQAVEDLSE